MKNSDKFWIAGVIALVAALGDNPGVLITIGMGFMLIGMFWEMREKKGD